MNRGRTVGILLAMIAGLFSLSLPHGQAMPSGSALRSDFMWRLARRRRRSGLAWANAVLFLVSEHAGWITGQTISVDGGK